MTDTRKRKKVKVVAVMYEDGDFDIFHDVVGRYNRSPNWRTTRSGKIIESWVEHGVTWTSGHTGESSLETVSNRPGITSGMGVV